MKWEEMFDMILFYAAILYKRQSFIRKVLNAVSLQCKQPEARDCQDGTVFKLTIHARTR